jgi:hypothetical protein
MSSISQKFFAFCDSQTSRPTRPASKTQTQYNARDSGTPEAQNIIQPELVMRRVF